MRDVVCANLETHSLSPNQCVFLEFFNVTQPESAFPGKCGVLGLGPINQNETATSYLYSLFNSSMIAKPLVTLAQSTADTNVNMMFGGIPDDLKNATVYSLKQSIKAPADIGWALDVRDVGFGTSIFRN